MIHPTAIIDPSATLPVSCQIGPYCVIGPDVELGENCRLLSHVVIEGPTKIGSNKDRKSTRLNSSHLVISYAVFCLKKKTNYPDNTQPFDPHFLLDSRQLVLSISKLTR